MWKVAKWLIAIVLLVFAGWVTFKWYINRSSISVNAISLIPPDAIYCITTESPIDAWKEISGSKTWSHLQGSPHFASLTASANKLDSLIRDNDLLFDLIGSRSLIVSAHMTGWKQYDFLFIVDLQEASGIKFVNEYISDLSAENMRVDREKYKEQDLVTFHNSADKTNLYTSFPGSYFIASYNRKIITSSIDAYQQDSLQSKNSFLAILNELSEPGLMKLYFNYKMLPGFVGCYTNTANEYTNRLSHALKATALNVTLENEVIKATGHTYINDSIDSYIRTLAISSEGPTEFAEIAPQRTAFAMALGFSSFAEFFSNFEKIIQQDVGDYVTYRENLKEVEKYLDVDLHEEFINWIGDEVVLLELQSSGQGMDNETALIFKANNIEKARRDLAYIEKMVRKKTPVKFKAIDHRGFSINYLSMKGLFKVLLGKFFARYDKPYYTVINNFVVFSNHPQTLESIIDDYLDKTTLAQSETYRDFRREFEDEGSVMVYINTGVLFHSLQKLADNTTRVSMERNKEYIVSFQQLGFQLVPETGGFRTVLAEKYFAPEQQALTANASEPLLSTTQVSTTESLIEPVHEVKPPADSDPMALPYIYVQNVNKPSFVSYFADSAVHFDVELKNGFKDGDYTEYYANGEVKMKGHFKDDKRDGLWRLFDPEGKLVMRRTYESGEIKRERVKD